MTGRPWTHGNRLIGVDLARRRVWVCGQRVHHGATGILLAAVFAAELVRIVNVIPPMRACA